MNDKSGPVTKEQIASLGKLREAVGTERYREIVLMMFDSPKNVNTKFLARKLIAELNDEIRRIEANKQERLKSSSDIDDMERTLRRIISKRSRYPRRSAPQNS